jgi:pimeloyl-ACP methyl ester carboxylesterase
MGNNEIFWLQLKFFKSKYRVISFNLPPIKGAEHLVDGIYENLKLNGVKKMALIGTSFGGYLAQVFSTKYCEMVDGLILSNAFITMHLYYQKNKFFLWFEKIISLSFIKRMMKK